MSSGGELEVVPLPPRTGAEVVERKGAGHPDTVADGLSEALGLALCREYLARFGRILHYNVDKALLVGGASRPRFGGGEVIEPVEVLLTGRATTEVGGDRVDVDGLVRGTVTGTSLEAGDDGQVGRGNRVSGLITPSRAMSLEAAAGKNPVTHVGKLYNVLASRVASRVAAVPGVQEAECLLVGRIGRPVRDPWLAQVRVRGDGGGIPPELSREAAEVLRSELDGLPALTRAVVERTIRAY